MLAGDGSLRLAPLAAIQVPPVLRVYRDPETPGYTIGVERLQEDQQERAETQGWKGPWELTTWSNLIEEVLMDPSLPVQELGPVPREEGAQETNLCYSATSLNAWVNPGARTKSKSAEFIVTPEDWHR